MNILEEIKGIRNETRLEIDRSNRNPYRILVREDGGLAAYCFSVPIYRESDKNMVDFRWKTEDGRQVFRGVNASVEVSQNAVLLRNQIGWAELNFESDACVEASFNGVGIICKGSQTTFSVRTDGARPIWENDGCFALMRDEYVPFLVVSGIVGKRNRECVPLGIRSEKRSEREHRIFVSCESGVESMRFEVNLHVPKLIFDTTVESKNPDKNNAFGGVAFLGTSEFFGEQWLYSRFDTMQILDLNGYLVERANLYLPKFGDTNHFLETFRMTAPWCSFGSTWNTKTARSELLYQSRQDKKYEVVEVSDVIKDVLRMNEPRNPGIVIKGDGKKAYTVVSTGDNCLLPQILEIKLKNNG